MYQNGRRHAAGFQQSKKTINSRKDSFQFQVSSFKLGETAECATYNNAYKTSGGAVRRPATASTKAARNTTSKQGTKMFTKTCFKNYQLLPLFLLFIFGLALISCTTTQNEAEAVTLQTTETSLPVEASFVPLTPALTTTVDIPPTAKPQEATATATLTPAATKIITTPILINLEIPLETENLPAYGWFSGNSQVVYFAYPEEGVTFNYNIATQQLISNTLSQKSDDQIIQQITADLPANTRVWEISPKYQNILYTVPISHPMTLERGAFTVSLDNELWLYKAGESTQLGAVDFCFLSNLHRGALWSPSETFAIVNAFAAMACAWNNWLIDLETFSVAPIDETWEEGNSGFYVAAILPNKQLLLTALLRDEPSAILDLQTEELTIFSNQGEEIVRYYNDAIFLDFLFWRSRDETEILFLPVSEADWQLIDVTEGLIRAKYVSPDQKHVLLFSGSPDFYGLSEHQETSGVWLLIFP